MRTIDAVKAAGYVGLILTVDSARGSRRERPMIHGSAPARAPSPFDGPNQAALTWDMMDRAILALFWICLAPKSSWKTNLVPRSARAF